MRADAILIQALLKSPYLLPEERHELKTVAQRIADNARVFRLGPKQRARFRKLAVKLHVMFPDEVRRPARAHIGKLKPERTRHPWEDALPLGPPGKGKGWRPVEPLNDEKFDEAIAEQAIRDGIIK